MNINKLGWYPYSAFTSTVSIFGTGRYSAGYHSRKANTITLTNPLIGNAVLPATYSRVMVLVVTNRYLSPLYKMTPTPNAARVTKNLRWIYRRWEQIHTARHYAESERP